jgi:hypothetical protein
MARRLQQPLSVKPNPDGSNTLRHGPPRPADDGPVTEADYDAICDHIKRHVGPVPTVLHEIYSVRIHLDVLPVDPTPQRPVRTLVTSGMSALPMVVPAGDDVFSYAELMVALPPDWPRDSKDERYFWPMRMLKTLARLPSNHDTWLGPGHTAQSEGPPEPYTAEVGFTGAVILEPSDMPKAFSPLRLHGRDIAFFYAYPLYPEEIAYKLNHGFDALLDRLRTVGLGLTPLIDPRRSNSCGTTI